MVNAERLFRPCKTPRRIAWRAALPPVRQPLSFRHLFGDGRNAPSRKKANGGAEGFGRPAPVRPPRPCPEPRASLRADGGRGLSSASERFDPLAVLRELFGAIGIEDARGEARAAIGTETVAW